MSDPKALTLSQLATKVQQTLNVTFGEAQFWVIADVTNHSFKASSNYHNFELVEKAPGSEKLLTKFGARAWGIGSRELAEFEIRTGQKFTSNIKVLLRVKVEYHPTYGIQLDVTGIDPNFTLGALEQQRQNNLERLCRDNPDHIKKLGETFWTSNKSLRLPIVIQNIAVISSKGSAGWQDFKHQLESNKYGYRFDLSPYFTEVQGEANAAFMSKRFIEIFESRIKYDLVVVIRGGGAQTDFLIFDQYIIGRVIARFPIPVLTGIGHQKNNTIADLMAHTSVKTPTEAAETIIKHNRAFDERLANIRQAVIIKAQQFLARHTLQMSSSKALLTQAGYQLIAEQKRQLNNIRQGIIGSGRAIPFSHRMNLANAVNSLLTYPKILMGIKRGEIVNTFANINAVQAVFLKNSRGQLSHFKSIFEAVSPEKTLKRGFAMVSYKGCIISDPEKLNTGDEFSVIMKETELKVLLREKKQHDGT